jgi:ubiquinol-cytochrome c reductase cytochrome b subunit
VVDALPIAGVLVGAVVFVLARALRDSGAEGVLHLQWKDVSTAARRRRRSPSAPGAEGRADEKSPERPSREPVP